MARFAENVRQGCRLSGEDKCNGKDHRNHGANDGKGLPVPGRGRPVRTGEGVAVFLLREIRTHEDVRIQPRPEELPRRVWGMGSGQMIGFEQ